VLRYIIELTRSGIFSKASKKERKKGEKKLTQERYKKQGCFQD
jgi:hypothetical protein